MTAKLEADRLVKKYKKRIEEKLKKNPNTIIYHQGRLDGYIEGLLDGMKSSLTFIDEEFKAAKALEKKLKDSK